MPEMNNNGNPLPSTSSFGASAPTTDSQKKVEQLKEQQQPKPSGFGIPQSTNSATDNIQNNGLGPGAAITNPINPPKPAVPTTSFDSVKTFSAPTSSFGGSSFGAAPSSSSFGASSIGAKPSDKPVDKLTDLPRPSFLPTSADNSKPAATSSFGGFSSSSAAAASPAQVDPFKPALNSNPSSFSAAPAPSASSTAKPFGSFGASAAPVSAPKKEEPVASGFGGLGASKPFAQSPAKHAEAPKPVEKELSKQLEKEPSKLTEKPYKFETAAKPVTAAVIPSPASTASIASSTNPAKPFSAAFAAPVTAATASPAIATPKKDIAHKKETAVEKKSEDITKKDVDMKKEKKVVSKKRTVSQAAASEKPQAVRHSGRARTAVKLPLVEAPIATEKKPIEIEQGSGTKFADIPHIKKELEKKKGADKIIVRLHQLLFGRPGEASKRKGNLRQFNGTSQDLKERLDRQSVDDLKALCVFVNLERSGEKAALIGKLESFLHSPKDFGESKAASVGKAKPKAKKPAAKKAIKKAAGKSGAKKTAAPKKAAKKVVKKAVEDKKPAEASSADQ